MIVKRCGILRAAGHLKPSVGETECGGPSVGETGRVEGVEGDGMGVWEGERPDNKRPHAKHYFTEQIGWRRPTFVGSPLFRVG